MKSYNIVFFVCEWLFSLNIFKGHLCCRMYWYFIPFYCLVLLHSMALSHSEFFHFLASMNNSSVNICVQGLVWTYVFVFLGCIPSSGVADHMVILCLTFWETVFQSGCTSLHSHSDCMRVLILLFSPTLDCIDYIQASGPEVLSCCDFDLQFFFLPYD